MVTGARAPFFFDFLIEGDFSRSIGLFGVLGMVGTVLQRYRDEASLMSKKLDGSFSPGAGRNDESRKRCSVDERKTMSMCSERLHCTE